MPHHSGSITGNVLNCCNVFVFAICNNVRKSWRKETQAKRMWLASCDGFDFPWPCNGKVMGLFLVCQSVHALRSQTTPHSLWWYFVLGRLNVVHTCGCTRGDIDVANYQGKTWLYCISHSPSVFIFPQHVSSSRSHTYSCSICGRIRRIISFMQLLASISQYIAVEVECVGFFSSAFT